MTEESMDPKAADGDLERAYAEMAADEEREADAREWIENLISG